MIQLTFLLSTFTNVFLLSPQSFLNFYLNVYYNYELSKLIS